MNGIGLSYIRAPANESAAFATRFRQEQCAYSPRRFHQSPCLEQLPLLHIPSGPSQAAENLEEEAKKTEEATKPRRFD